MPDDKKITSTPSTYQDLLNANPYRSNSYQDSIWDKIGDFFGFNTRADDIRLNYEQAAAKYDSEIEQMKFQNEYNAASAQAARQRAAGINPDLIGAEGTPSAAPSTGEISAAIPENGMATFQQFAGSCMNVLSMAFDLTSKVHGIRGLKLDNEGKDIGNLLSALGAGSGLADTLTTFGYDPTASAAVEGNLLGFSTTDKEGRTSLSPLMKFNSSAAARRVSDATNRVYHSIGNLSKIYGGLKSADESRKAFLRSTASQYNNADFGEGDAVLQDISRPLVKYWDRILSGKARADAKTAENEAIYQEQRDPTLEAETEQAVNKETKASSERNYDLNSTMREIIHNLSETAKGKGADATMANCALILMSALSGMNGSIKLGKKGKLGSIGF